MSNSVGSVIYSLKRSNRDDNLMMELGKTEWKASEKQHYSYINDMVLQCTRVAWVASLNFMLIL
ncbi:hypothetical protein LINGRAHAP2_LOCUS12993 [Linum grandiflorum]